jgi:hypothetical protein
MSELSIHRWKNEEYRDNQINAIRRGVKNPARRKQLSEISNKFWSSVGIKAIMSKKISKSWKINKIERIKKLNCQVLLENQVIEIKKLLKLGEISGRKIAKLYKVSQGAIAAIAQGRTWKWVK